MRHSHASSPKVNAGSMADIAFLLLIFFLVTTTISTDAGIQRKLPKDCPPGIDCTNTLHERNVFRISLNGNQEILVEDKRVTLNELKNLAKEFIDNNGDQSCTYCHGSQSVNHSDNPKKAVISLENDRGTSYELFIGVQDELTKAYYDLRKTYAKEVINKLPETLTDVELKQVKDAYPFIISEANTKKRD